MSVFIRKERLGSTPPPRPDTFRIHKKHFVNGTPFGEVARNFSEAREQFAQERKEQFESNAEVQRSRTQMTSEERARDAIDRMIPTAKAVHEMRTGSECTHEEARKVAENLAYKSDADKKK